MNIYKSGQIDLLSKDPTQLSSIFESVSIDV